MNYKELIDNIKETHIVNYIMNDIKYYVNYNIQIKKLKEILTGPYSHKYEIDELINYLIFNYENYNLIFDELHYIDKRMDILDNKFDFFNKSFYERSCSKNCEVKICLFNWKISNCITNIFKIKIENTIL